MPGIEALPGQRHRLMLFPPDMERAAVGGARATGPVAITYNDPFPPANGRIGSSSAVMISLVMHTMVGNLPAAVAHFNDPVRGVPLQVG
jgi:hypothetical protein